MKERDKVNGMTLESMYDLIYRSHSWISFSPEKRAVQYITEYSQMLDNDLLELGENKGNYKEKFISKFTSWMASKGNCASSAITGGSGFNVRRAEKANNVEHSKNMDFHNWRESYFKAVNRVTTPSPEEELDNALQELDSVSNRQEMMKEINALSRKNKGGLNDFLELLTSMDFPNEMIQEVHSNQKHGYGIGFASFELTNNNAKIKRLKDKVSTMKARIEMKQSFKDVIFDGGYLTIADDRVKIFHDEKPSQEIIQKLKSNGFRWSSNWKCWCRKHTQNAVKAGINIVK